MDIINGVNKGKLSWQVLCGIAGIFSFQFLNCSIFTLQLQGTSGPTPLEKSCIHSKTFNLDILSRKY